VPVSRRSRASPVNRASLAEQRNCSCRHLRHRPIRMRHLFSPVNAAVPAGPVNQGSRRDRRDPIPCATR
jgi:hypothetical protein